MPSESVDLMVTSPPYYNQREYASWPTYEAYLENMYQILKELNRVMKDDGIVCWNIVTSLLHEKTFISGDTNDIFLKAGFKFFKDIYWIKSGFVQSGFGSTIQSPKVGNYHPNMCTEIILVYMKNSKKKNKTPFDLGYVKTFCNNAWMDVKEVRRGKGGVDAWGHSTAYPEELVKRLIYVYSNPKELVLDVFSGSGTTACVAKKMGRNFIGIERNEEYHTKSIERLKTVNVQKTLSDI